MVMTAEEVMMEGVLVSSQCSCELPGKVISPGTFPLEMHRFLSPFWIFIFPCVSEGIFVLPLEEAEHGQREGWAGGSMPITFKSCNLGPSRWKCP